MNIERIQKRRWMLTITDASMFCLYFVLWLFGTPLELTLVLFAGHVLTHRHPLRFAASADGYGYRKFLEAYVRLGPFPRDDKKKLPEASSCYHLLSRKFFPKEMWVRMFSELAVFVIFVGAATLLMEITQYQLLLLIKLFVIFEMRNLIYWFLQGRYDHFPFTTTQSFAMHLQYKLGVDSYHFVAYQEKARECGWLREL